MTEFQEFPKALYGPEGVVVAVDDAEEEAAQLAEWAAMLAPTEQQLQDAADRLVAEHLAVPDVLPRRGRPPKAR